MYRATGEWTRPLMRAGLHVALMVIAYLGGLYIRFEGAVRGPYWTSFWRFLPGMVALAMFVYLCLRVYMSSQRWRAVLAGLITLVAATIAGRQLAAIPLSVAVFGALVSSLGYGAIRRAVP
jgi:hypothetical protein